MSEEIKVLLKEMESLKFQLEELRKFRRDDRQHINKLEVFINEKKSNGRRDYTNLAQELVEYMAKRIPKYRELKRASLTYKEVMLCLHLEHPQEPYRAMQKTAQLYPEWVQYKNNGSKKLLIPTLAFKEYVLSTEGNIWSRG